MGLTDIHYAAQQYVIFLLGHDYPHGVWWYFPVELSIKTTLGLIGLVVLAGVALARRRLRQMSWHLAVLGVIYFTAAILSSTNIGTRHVLLSLAALLAAAGLTALAQHSRRWMWIGGALVACHIADRSHQAGSGVAGLNVSVTAVFPAEMAYGNATLTAATLGACSLMAASSRLQRLQRSS